MGGACNTDGRYQKCINIFVGKPEGKRTLGRPRCRWENIRLHIKGNRIKRCGLDASGSGTGPVAGCCENGNERPGSMKGGEFLD
jgi:hypothetical protein